MSYFKYKSAFFLSTIVLGFLFLTISDIDAQRFKGSAVFGINLAQIDGDALYGYNKLGLTGGFKLEYPVAEKFDVSLEMLYSDRGSTAGFGFGSSTDSFGISLQYLSVPLMIKIKDWKVKDEDYYKVSAHAGLSPGYLFSSSTLTKTFPDNDELAKVDLSYILGITYKFTKAIGMTIRYTRSMTNLLATGGMSTGPRAISYFLTIRTEYSF